MLIAHNNVAAPPPNLRTDFNLVTQDDGDAAFRWHHTVAQYVSSTYTAQYSYDVGVNYLNSYTATFTPRGTIPAGDGLGVSNGRGVAEYDYTLGPFPPGAVVQTRLVGSPTLVWDTDMVLAGTNFLVPGLDRSGVESWAYGGYGLPYLDAEMQPGMSPPSFLFSAYVKTIRVAARLSRIVGPIYGDLFRSTSPVEPWLKWYQTYTDELNFGHGIDAIPGGQVQNMGRIDFGDGKTFWAPTSPRDGVVICELQDELAGDRVTVHYKNLVSSGSRGLATCVVDLAGPQPRYVDISGVTYGDRLHASTYYSGLFNVAERPAIVLGAGGYGQTPTHTLPPSQTKLWMLDDYYSSMREENSGRRVIYWNKRPPLLVRISVSEPGFSWSSQ